MLNRAEAAKYLGVSVRTLDRYAETKRIPFRFEEGKTKPRKVFDESELKAYRTERAAARARMLPDLRTPEAMERVGFRLDPEDMKLLRQQATARGDSPGSYARHLVIVALHEQPPLLETNAALETLTRAVAGLREEVSRGRQTSSAGAALVDLQRAVEGIRGDFASVLLMFLTQLTDVTEAEGEKYIRDGLRRGMAR